MRVVSLFNMANNGYLTTKALRMVGVEADLYYESPSYILQLPEWQDGEVDEDKIGLNIDKPDMTLFKWKRPEWCHPVINELNMLTTVHGILEAEDVDVVVGHAPFVKVMVYVMRSYRFRNPWIIYEAGMIRNLEGTTEGSYMKFLYRLATKVLYANIDMQPLLAYLNCTSGSYCPLPIDTDKFTPQPRDHDHTVFLHPTRHYFWEKGNDKVIAAFKEYLKHDPTAELRLCGWGGQDLQAAQMMCYQYNILENVTWMNLKCKNHLIEEYRNATVVFDQFTYAATGGIGPEAMSCGIPVVSHVDKPLFLKYHPSAPPIFDASSVIDVYERMLELQDESVRKEASQAGRRWVVENQGLRVVGEMEKRICQEAVEAHEATK